MANTESDTTLPITPATPRNYTKREKAMMTTRKYVIEPAKILREDNRAIIGFTILLAYILVGTIGVWYMEPTTLWHGDRLEAPFQSWEHPLGTDNAGYDILTMLVYGTQPILIMTASGAIFATSIATVLGMVSGYVGGLTDQVLSAILDIALTIPGLPLVIVLAVTLRPSHPVAIGILLTINAWGGLGRNIRSQVLAIRRESYVEASRAMGIGRGKIIWSDLLPNMMPYIVYNFMTSARNVIFASVGLYYLGILPYTQQNWGVMLDDAQSGGALTSASIFQWMLFPILTIVLLSVALILLGQSADKLFNPRVRARNEAPTK